MVAIRGYDLGEGHAQGRGGIDPVAPVLRAAFHPPLTYIAVLVNLDDNRGLELGALARRIQDGGLKEHAYGWDRCIVHSRITW